MPSLFLADMKFSIGAYTAIPFSLCDRTSLLMKYVSYSFLRQKTKTNSQMRDNLFPAVIGKQHPFFHTITSPMVKGDLSSMESSVLYINIGLTFPYDILYSTTPLSFNTLSNPLNMSKDWRLRYLRRTNRSMSSSLNAPDDWRLRKSAINFA